MKKSILLLIWLLSLIPIVVKSSIITLTTDQGLASNTINCIYKDRMGFVWIGTANGLSRYDGIDVCTFNDFYNKSVIGIVEQGNSTLYILTEKELYKYDRSTRKKILIETLHEKDNSFKAFALDRQGDLYFISQTGLYVLSNGKTAPVKIKGVEKIGRQSLSDLLIDSYNKCWIASGNGLIEYNAQTREVLNYKNTFGNDLTCITRQNNTLYSGTQNGDILLFNVKSKEFSRVKKFGNAYIQTLKYFESKLYVGTNGNGLKILDLSGHNTSLVTNPFQGSDNLNINAIYSIFVDEHSCWIGTFSGGISYIASQQNRFKLFGSGENFSTEKFNIRSFNVNNKGLGIYGTRSGLICNTTGQPTFFTTENTPELKSNIILCIHPYGNNEYLIGTYNGGLYLFDSSTKKIKKFRNEPIFSNNSFYSIVNNKSGVLFLGTLSGLIKYDISKNLYTVFNTSNSDILSNDIYALCLDSSDRLWIGTKSGVCYLEKGKIKKPTILNAFSTGVVRYIYEDSGKNIWLGTETQGAIFLSSNLKTYKRYTDQDVLPDNYVSSIIEDHSGQIWMVTRKGVVRRKSDSSYSIYSLYDGIPSYTFNDAAIQMTDSTIWLGNEKGLIGLETAKIPVVTPSQIYITQVVINGIAEDVTLKNLHIAPEYLDKIMLPASEKNLIFKFSDLKYDFPSSVIYEYKLEGFDDKWHKTVAGKEIVISAIPSGRYLLKIREAGNEKSVKTITIQKKKSFFVYWMLSILLPLVFVAVFYYLRFVKVRQINRSIRRKQSLEKEDKVKYQNMKLNKDELESIKDAIVKYMEEEKPYLNSEFKLDDMANAINVSKTKISQVLNTHLDTNFSNLTSKYRIIAFKQKAKDGLLQQYTLSALAKECGFSSRSSFFYSVKKLTGQTPAEFLKDTDIEVDNLDN